MAERGGKDVNVLTAVAQRFGQVVDMLTYA